MVRKRILNILKLGYKKASGRPIFARFPLFSKSFHFVATRVLVHSEDVYTIRGHKMHIPADDASLYAYTLDDYEPAKTEVFVNSLHAGDVAIDVGAHIGYYTLLAARRVGENGRVFAFEPDPNNYSLLVENIKLNNYENVVPVKKAVSNKTGSTELFLASSSSTHSLFLAPASQAAKSIVVDSLSLDDFFSKYPSSLTARIRLIKIDTEGAEMVVLLGMSQLMKDKPLTIITDVAAHQIINSGFEPAEFVSKLVEYGFELNCIGEKAYDTREIVDMANRGVPWLDLLCSKSS
jgi:FkbM family methyltransferase